MADLAPCGMCGVGWARHGGLDHDFVLTAEAWIDGIVHQGFVAFTEGITFIEAEHG